MSGRVFDRLGVRNGLGLALGGDWSRRSATQRRRDGDDRPGDLGDLAALGSTRSEGRQLLARVQQAVVAAQCRDHAARRPACRTCGVACHVKGYRPHRIATLFGELTLWLLRFRCAGCGVLETGVGWPAHGRSNAELDQLRAHLSAIMPHRVAAGVLEHLLPVDAGIDPKTLRARTLRVGVDLVDTAALNNGIMIVILS
jgi:hypothetical protein